MAIEVVYPHAEQLSRHDVRWIRRLKASGFSVRAIPDSELTQFARHRTEAPRNSVVWAGDLERAVHCVALGLSPIVGLSWGSDLWEEAAFGRLLQRLHELEQLNAIVVDNDASRERLESVRCFVPTHVIPWGVNTLLFRPSRSSNVAGQGSRVVLSLRAHDELHGVGDVIEAYCIAASADHALRLVVAGSGPGTVDYRQYVARHGLSDRVAFVGELSSLDVAITLRSASLTVSAARVDGSSVSLMECLSSGVASLVPESPCNSWWIPDEGVGRLYALGDIDEMARQMVAPPNEVPSNELRRRQLVLERAQLPSTMYKVRNLLARVALGGG